MILLALPCGAKERLQRRFDQRDGLPVAEVTLAQDSRGFLWIGSAGGLVRWDGQEMRRWVESRLAPSVRSIVACPRGGVFILDDRGTPSEVVPEGLAPVPDGEGQPMRDVASVACDASDRLWAIAGSRIVQREGARWLAIDSSALKDEQPLQLRPSHGGQAVFLATDRGLWRLNAGSAPEPIAELRDMAAFVARDDGSFVAVTRTGGIFEGHRGRVEPRARLEGRGIDVVERGSTTWVSIDRYLVALRPGEAPEVIGPGDDLPSGGPLLVDREGSLWLCTFRGVIQFPEPETVAWNDHDGLPSAHTRRLLAAPDGLWVDTWQGTGRLLRTPSGWRATALRSPTTTSCFCFDKRGTVWTGRGDGFVAWRDGRYELFPWRGLTWPRACAAGAGGRLWMTAAPGLFFIDPDVGPRLVPQPESGSRGDQGPGLVFEDGERRLWVGHGETLCETSADALAADGSAAWDCEKLPGTNTLTKIVQLPSGSLWVATATGGVWRRGRNAWERIPGSDLLASRAISGMAPSISGGVWVLGRGVAVRVGERLDRPDGWEVLEELHSWQGLPTIGGEDALEETDGSLWLTGAAGVIHLPGSVRRYDPAPPTVELVAMAVDGKPLALDAPPQLPYRRNRLEMRFAVPSYRDRGLLRYRFRLKSDAPWSEGNGPPSFHFVDLPPGRYHAEVEASLDAAHWSPRAAVVDFEIEPPWWLRWWALALDAAAASVTLAIAYRVRVAMLLRLERQRTRIAMDLHDEMGSGLGSIGILANLAADDTVPEAKRRTLAREIAETAGELTAALSDIVWSLRRGSSSLKALAEHLADRGRRMMPADRMEFTTSFPERWPEVRMSLAARRSLQLIASEALHNAVRHSGAQRVELGLEPVGGRWRLWVADDGCGFPADVVERGAAGLGLTSMRARAEQIGTELMVERPRTGTGTVISVVFHPAADDRRARPA